MKLEEVTTVINGICATLGLILMFIGFLKDSITTLALGLGLAVVNLQLISWRSSD